MSDLDKEPKKVEEEEEEEDEESEKEETKPEATTVVKEDDKKKELKEEDDEEEEEESEKEEEQKVKPVEEVTKEEEKPVEEVTKEEEKPIEEVTKQEEKPVEEVNKEEEKPVEEVTKEEEKPVEEDNKSTDSSHSQKEFDLGDCRVSAEWSDEKESVKLVFRTNSSDKLLLHWGLYKNEPINCWYHPAKENFPEKTKEYDAFALETDFVEDEKEKKIELKINKSDAKGLSFVFYNPESGKWYNNYDNDFQIQF